MTTPEAPRRPAASSFPKEQGCTCRDCRFQFPGAFNADGTLDKAADRALSEGGPQ